MKINHALLHAGKNPDREYVMTTPADLARTIKAARRALKRSQAELAAAAGVGVRFIVELEAGKPAVQLGKTLTALRALGLECHLVSRAETLAPHRPQ